MTEKGIESDAEVQSFVQAVHEKFGSEIPRATTVAVTKHRHSIHSVIGLAAPMKMIIQEVSELIAMKY